MVNVLCIAFLPYFKVLVGGPVMVVNNRNMAISKEKVLMFDSIGNSLFFGQLCLNLIGSVEWWNVCWNRLVKLLTPLCLIGHMTDVKHSYSV
jgi:hypothetical protein